MKRVCTLLLSLGLTALFTADPAVAAKTPSPRRAVRKQAAKEKLPAKKDEKQKAKTKQPPRPKSSSPRS